MPARYSRHFALALLVAGGLANIAPSAQAADAKPIAIAEIKHEGPVDFEKEILPILRRNCLACHNATDAESDLVLETPATILKGGALGPAAVAMKGAESLILKAAALQEEPHMPPANNKAGAKRLTPEELGLLKLWIDQGATGEVSASGGPVAWQPLPVGVNPIFASALTLDGRYAAASRANQIFMYHLGAKLELGRLTDPALIDGKYYSKPGVADLDLIQSLAFSPDGMRLASGGYRTAKIWKRGDTLKKGDLAGLDAPPRSLAISADGRLAAVGQENGQIKLFNVAEKKVVHTLSGHTGSVDGLSFSPDGTRLASGGKDKTLRLWNTADGQPAGQLETPAEVTAVAYVLGGQQIATGGADNVIRTWTPPAPPAPAQEGQAAPEPPKPLKELKGHGGPITSLATFTGNPAHLASGSQDGTLRVWDVNSAGQVRSLAHGGPVLAVAASPDGQRFLSVGANKVAKLWNGGNNQQVAELKSDFRALDNIAKVTRERDLAKRIMDLVKNDHQEAQKRKTAEEENAKKAEEEKKKAEEEMKKKTEAAVKPVAEKEEADKKVVADKEALVKAEEAKKAADEAAPKADEALKKSQEELNAANTALTQAETALNQATEAAKKAQEASAAAADNQDLAKAAEEAKKAQAEAETKKTAAAEDKAAKEKALAESNQKKQDADKAKRDAEQGLQQAKNTATQSEAKAKQLEAPATKATEEKMAAERAFQAAMRSIERAAESIKKAGEGITAEEANVKTAEEKHQDAEAKLKQTQETATANEKPLAAAAFSPDGKLAAIAGEGQAVFTYAAETGAPGETCGEQGAPIVALAFAGNEDLLSVAQNQTIVDYRPLPEWTLERVIGSVESGEAFVDRVTALDFNFDGTLLATGGGEPSRSGQIKIWKVADGTLAREFKEPHSDTVLGLEFSPDDRNLASCGADRFMKVFDLSSGNLVKSFEGHTHHVMGVSWQADGRRLATCGADNVVKVWDFRTGEQYKTITGYGKEVTAIEFAGIDVVAAAVSGDKTVRLNDTNAGNVRRQMGGAGDYLYTVDASADGKTIIAGGQDSVLRVWNDNGQELSKFDPPAPPPTEAKSGG